MEHRNMEQQLIEFISREFLSDDAELGNEDDLLTTGLIDSLGVMRLVSFMETEFCITVPPQDVTIENFLSVRTIAEYVAGRKTNTTVSDTQP